MKRLGTLLEQLDYRRIEAARDYRDLKASEPATQAVPPFAGPTADATTRSSNVRKARCRTGSEGSRRWIDGRDLTPPRGGPAATTRAAGLRGCHGAADQVLPGDPRRSEERVALRCREAATRPADGAAKPKAKIQATNIS